MIPKKRFKAQQDLMKNLETVQQELLKIPDVLAVGIGIKESNNEFTDEIAYRVFVKEKKDPSSLKSNEIIPKTIDNIKTDVLTPYEVKERPDVCGTERQTLTQHRPLQAGIAISYDSLHYGTLGWFGTLVTEDKRVILSNHHVLYNTPVQLDTSEKKTAQPQLGEVSSCCCCECGSDNVVGKTVIGIRNTGAAPFVDCAISLINDDLVPNINYHIANDATDQVLSVTGVAQAVVGERVRKIGARSGYTQGVVVHVGDAAVAGTDPAGNTITIRTQQVLIIPHASETYQVNDRGTCKFAFSNNGDSGSVILNDEDEIVALLYGGTEKSNSVDITFANNINNVINAFTANGKQITLSTTAAGRSAVATAKKSTAAVPETEFTILEEIRDMNKQSLLTNLFDKHYKEVLDLINNRRPVSVVWQRNQGPAYVAAIVRAAKHKEYQIPEEIEQIKRISLLSSMEAVLIEHGSTSLKEDIQIYRESLTDILQWNNTIEDIAEALKAAHFIDSLPSGFSTITK